MLDGFMICPMCGSYLTIFTDMQTALFYQRLESIAQKMGLTIEQSDYDEGFIRGSTYRGQGEERRPARSLLRVIKDGALNHYQRAINNGFGSILEHVEQVAFTAYNYAAQNCTPEMFEFIERLAWCALPDPGRTYEERATGRKARQFKLRLVYVPLTPDRAVHIEEIDATAEFYLFAGGRFMRLDHFSRYYAALDYEQRDPVLGFRGVFEPSEEDRDEEAVMTSFCTWILREGRDHFGVMPGFDHDVITAFQHQGDIRGGSHAAPGYQQATYTREEWDDHQRQYTQQEWDEWSRWHRQNRRWHDDQGGGDYHRHQRVPARAVWQQDYERRPVNQNQQRHRAQQWLDQYQ